MTLDQPVPRARDWPVSVCFVCKVTVQSPRLHALLRITIDLFDSGPQGLGCLVSGTFPGGAPTPLIKACGFSCSTTFGILVP